MTRGTIERPMVQEEQIFELCIFVSATFFIIILVLTKKKSFILNIFSQITPRYNLSQKRMLDLSCQYTKRV